MSTERYIDPKKEVKRVPDFAPDITVYLFTPNGPTVSLTREELMKEYIDDFTSRIEGMGKRPKHLKDEPWHKVLSKNMCNFIFLELSKLHQLSESEERD